MEEGVEKEVLKKIPGFENYRVSNFGNIYNTTSKGKTYPIKLSPVSSGHSIKIGLRKENKTHQLTLSLLVAKAFIENEKNLKYVKHLDGDFRNNNANNLFWSHNRGEEIIKSENLKVCDYCKQSKYDTSFIFTKSGKKYNSKNCAECRYQIRKIKHGHKFEEYRNRSHFKEAMTLEGRASLMFYRCVRRARVDKKEISIKKEDILELLSFGVCQKTGIKLIIDGTKNNPYSPSVDRIDNSVGYTKENIQIVCAIYNFCKNQFSDDDVLEFIKRFSNNLKLNK